MSHSLSLIAVMCAAHIIADFPFQGDWIAAGKGKSWEILAYHCLVIGSVLVFVPPPLADISWLAIGMASHFVINAAKARYHWVKTIWQDQLLHLAVILILVGTGLVT